MDSRMDKYSSNATSSSRTSRNKQLYDDLYKNTSYSNSVIIDESKEIDISKIKEIIDNEKKDDRQRKTIKSSKDLYNELKDISYEEPEKKVYDINEVLRNAKSKRDIIEEANEKRKIRSSKYTPSLSVEEELAKTRKMYNNLLKEETELLDIMNTLTNVSKDELANEMFKDLTDTMPIKDRGIEVTQISEPKEETKEYSTNTFLFDDKDFDSVKSEIGKSSKLLKFFTFLLTVIVIVGIAIFIKIFVLK